MNILPVAGLGDGFWNENGNEYFVRSFFVIASVLVIASAATAADFNLIPWPERVQPLAGQFSLDEKTVIVADAPFTNEAAWLAGKILLPLTAAAKGDVIRLTTQGAENLGDEAYALEVDHQGATIRAHSSAGAFYGSQTLSQLLSAKKIPCVKIEDAPRYAWRGMMLDVSRHFFDKPTILQLLDWMAAYKLNRFHLHLTDDQGWRLEMEKYPELTQTGAVGNYSDTNTPACFFTRTDIQEIIRYAAQRHIVVVPEIDMPGHAGAVARTYPTLAGSTNSFNPASEQTYAFLENVLRDTMELFPSPWIHFGGDEVKSSAWKNNPDAIKKMQADGLKDTKQLESSFVRRIAGFIAKNGRTPAGWDEIAAAGTEPGALIYWWRHDKPEVLTQALAGGHSVVLSPRAPCYFDYPQDKSFPYVGGWKLWITPEDVYRGPSIPTNIPPAQLKQILGVEGCVWTERITTVPYLEFMILPRMIALSEMAWTADGQRDFVQFNFRLKPHLEAYRQLGIQFYDAANPAETRRSALQAGVDFRGWTNLAEAISKR